MIQEFSIDHKSKVLELFHLAFGKQMEENFWDWRYIRNPYSSSQLIDLMWNGDDLIGHYALWPMEFCFNDEIIKGALSMTTMTHPDHGSKGIFTKLAQSVYKRAFEQNDIELIWGFPNRNSHYGFISKLQWKDVAVLPMVSNWMEFRNNSKSLDYTVIEQFTAAHEDVVKRYLPNNTLTVNKTEKYLNWRYNEHPLHKYYSLTSGELDGFIVVKIIPSFDVKGEYELDILEWCLPRNLHQVEVALDIINSFAKDKIYSSQGKVRTNMWMSVHDHMFQLLEKNRFIISQPLTYLGQLSEGNSRFEHYSGWSLSLGDSDVF